MINIINTSNSHKHAIRVLTHVMWWILVATLYYLARQRFGEPYINYMIIKDVVIVSTLFYTAPWLFSRGILNKKITHYVILLISSFFCWLSGTYLLFFLLDPYVTPADTRIFSHLHFVMAGGYFSLFSAQKLLFFVFDFVLVVSLPFLPKIGLLVQQSSAKPAIVPHTRAKLEQEHLAMELQLLKAQISPHFLFNTLNSLHHLAETADSRTAATILRLSNLLKYTLYQAGCEKIPLEQELQLLTDYLSLVQLRFGADVAIDVKFEPIPEPYKIAPLIFIPLVENAIKHGPERSRAAAWVNISMQFFENYLLFTIANAVNKNSEKLPAGGIGLANVKRRLELCYKDRHHLTVHDGQEDFEVRLKIFL